MRREEKEIVDREEIESVINQARVCRLGLCDEGVPYVIPICFGYKEGSLYFHSAVEGKKVDIIKRNNQVCVEFDIESELSKAEDICKWGMRYRSVICYGNASIIHDQKRKEKGLKIIISQYTDANFDFPKYLLDRLLVIEVNVSKMTGKISLT